eukprot:Pgem_evm1s15141
MVDNIPKWPDKRSRVSLPIDSRLQEIFARLRGSQILICEAETGAGKTTRIAQAAFFENYKVILTQPRRNACRWNATRIAKEMGSKLGGIVGYKLYGEESNISAKTRLELLVDQSLVNRITRHRCLPEGLIIVDEAHERSVTIELLLGLIKEYLPKSPNTKILITSATIDTKKFSNFFDNAPIFEIKGKCYEVEERPFAIEKHEHHTEGACRAAAVILEDFSQDRLFLKLKGGLQKLSKGTILVLLPGKEDILQTVENLQTQIGRLGNLDPKKVEILPCHGDNTPEEQNMIQNELPDNCLRIVCGTEILRSSVTVEGVIGVIDSLQIKRMISHPNGVDELLKIAISKAEAHQARGRAGRTAPGFYIPVGFENEYIRLKEWPEPAILRERLSNVTLQLAKVERSIRDFSFVDVPDIEKIDVAIQKLQIINALSPYEEITDIGHVLVNLPLEPNLAYVLLKANELKVLGEAIILVSALSVEGFFSYKYSRKDNEFEANDDFSLI